MEKLFYLNNLFDLYGELLTEKQKSYFIDYYFNNLSYGEIANKYQISRNAIYRQLKLIEERLVFYEEKLNLYSKKKKINDIMIIIDDEKVREELDSLF